MREILFRGKIIELCEYQGQWLEGFYAVENGKHFIAIPKENGLNGFYCDPETVGQYTGLKDKNGTRIFEGDVIRDEDGDVMFVKWVTESAAFVLEPKSYASIYFYGTLSSRIEVIGNIYDNAELIRGV